MPEICKPRFSLSIRHLVSGLKTRVFRSEGGVGGFQMLIFDLLVKILYRHFCFKSLSMEVGFALCGEILISTYSAGS
jgi:hypothetical protein